MIRYQNGMVRKGANTKKEMVSQRDSTEKDLVPKMVGTTNGWYRMSLTKSGLYQKVPDQSENQLEIFCTKIHTIFLKNFRKNSLFLDQQSALEETIAALKTIHVD